MARSRKTKDKPARSKRPIEQYDHKGQHKRVAVKIVDDRGIESLKIIPVP